jgi:hypothetical protein
MPHAKSAKDAKELKKTMNTASTETMVAAEGFAKKILCGIGDRCVRPAKVFFCDSRKEREGRKEAGELCANASTAVFGQSIHNAFDAVLQMDFTEVDQQPKPPVAQPKLGEQLFAVNFGELLNGFEFNDYLVLDQQVGAEAFVKFQIIVTDGNRNLTLHTQPQFLQFVGERHFIYGLQQSGAGAGVNFERSVKNQFGQFIFGQGSDLVLHRPSGCSCPKRFSRLVSRKGRKGRKGFSETRMNRSAVNQFPPLRPSRPLREVK